MWQPKHVVQSISVDTRHARDGCTGSDGECSPPHPRMDQGDRDSAGASVLGAMDERC